jgi:cytochrome c-type biogenesis protein
MQEITLFAAFAAGVLSVLSPCVFPLIPVYLSFLSGTVAQSRRYVVLSTLLFIAGFSAVFILLSVVFAGAAFLLGNIKQTVNIIAGGIVILFGVNQLFHFIPFLNYEKRVPMTGKPARLSGSFVFGAAFGAGWTPCIGPVLASILFLSAQSEHLGRSVLYLTIYSIGLGLPFFLAALFSSAFSNIRPKILKYLPVIQILSGILIILIGILILLGRLAALNGFFTKIGWTSEWAAL